MIAFNLITLLLFFPETKYSRQRPIEAGGSAPEETSSDPELKSDPAQHVERLNYSMNPGQGHASSKQYLLFQRASPRWRDILAHSFVATARMTLSPIVLFATLNLMGSANLVLYWNITESSILGNHPYNFSTSQVGFANFGFAGGALLGLATAGPFSDWAVKKATDRNGGVREAEMRLPALIPFAIICIAGTVIGGVAARGGWAWPVLVVIGYGTAGMSMASIPTITIAYAVDAYKPISGEIMVLGTVLKNTTGFGMTYWVGPMVVKHGYITPLMVWLAFTAGPLVLALPLYIWGKKLRKATKNSSMHSYEDIL